MKTIEKSFSGIILIAFLLVLPKGQANATVITVSNNPVDSAAAMYSDLQAAIDAASAGDTIYVSGSPISYGNITITKQLTLIGAGYNPDNQHGYATKIGTLNLSEAGLPYPSTSDGTSIIGFDISGIHNNSYQGCDDITVERNRIQGLTINGKSDNHSTGWIIVNNIFSIAYNAYLHGNSYVFNTIIANNIITGENYYSYGIFTDFSNGTVIIKNNLFLDCDPAFSGLSNVTLSNNIFFGASVGNSTSQADYCTFLNNISYGGTYTSFSYGTNTAVDNIEDTSPDFVSVSGQSFDYSYDYHLQGTSPGKNAGSDGTDIGIYGGSYPLPSGGDVPWQTSAMPAIPQIMQLDILNSTLPADSTLRVRIKARIQE